MLRRTFSGLMSRWMTPWRWASPTTAATCSVVVGKLPKSAAEVLFLDCPELYDRPEIYGWGRDEHLRKPDFFNVEQFPTATFKATSVRKTADDVFETFMNSFARTLDPHSSYLSPRQSEEYRIQMSLSYQGIGASLQLD